MLFASLYLCEESCGGVLLSSGEGAYTVLNAWVSNDYDSPQEVLKAWDAKITLLNWLPDLESVHMHPLADEVFGDVKLAPRSNRFTERAKFKALVRAEKLILTDFTMNSRLTELLNAQQWDSPLVSALVMGVVHEPKPLVYSYGSSATVMPRHRSRCFDNFGRAVNLHPSYRVPLKRNRHR